MSWTANNNTQDTAALEGSTFQKKFGVFCAGIPNEYISTKKAKAYRILPARNPRLPKNDPSYNGSYVAYRDNQGMHTQWRIAVPVFKNVGNDREDIISQAVLNSFGVSHPDYQLNPLLMIRLYAYGKQKGAIVAPRSVHGFTSWADYAKRAEHPKKTFEKFAAKIIPNENLLFALNLASVNPTSHRVEGNIAATISEAAMKKMEPYFDVPRSADQEPDPQDPLSNRLCFGDITHPIVGPMCVPKEFALDNGKSTTGLSFSTDMFRRQDWLSVPVTQAILDGRFDMMSSKVLRVPTSKEVAEYIVADGTIPRELLRLAWDGTVLADLIPAGEPAAKTHHNNMPKADNDWGQPTEPAPGPKTSPAAAKLSGKVYTVYNQVTAEKRESVSETVIRSEIAMRTCKAADLLLWTPEFGESWKPALECGFSEAPVATPPPVKAAPPPVPSAPAAPAAPALPKQAAQRVYAVQVTQAMDEIVNYTSVEAIRIAHAQGNLSDFDTVRSAGHADTTVGALLGIAPKAAPAPAVAVADGLTSEDIADVRAAFSHKFDENNPRHIKFALLYKQSNKGATLSDADQKFLEEIVGEIC